MPEVTSEIRAEIEQLVTEHHWLLDHGHADRLYTLYAEDAVSTGPLGTMDGREAVKAWGERRAKMDAGVVRHFSGGTRLAFENGVLCGTTYYMTFRDSQSDPLHPASVGEFREQYTQVDGRWLIHRREIAPIFGAANAAAHAQRIAAGEAK
ncbi:nuclear transport factor 2 family protein [Arthrobacter sp. zg-Y238]|uniref:nuclear transport factor 2 family protein n=1 Tax=Arthrobacter sp. zg-Y238 TaxID=2964614 RepID=UPI0021062BFA|nr:nuclear transport factor 2 family protein [Arthrobacter sp. zg-Y238]MCQ1952213.1 nuclear transport factor 2 family protein [Arthrobacter sp. zg-Y238]